MAATVPPPTSLRPEESPAPEPSPAWAAPLGTSRTCGLASVGAWGFGGTPSGRAVGVAGRACSFGCSTDGGAGWAVGGRSGCWGALTAGPLPASTGPAEGVAVGVTGAAAFGAALGALGAPPSAQACPPVTVASRAAPVRAQTAVSRETPAERRARLVVVRRAMRALLHRGDAGSGTLWPVRPD
ncbi:hypothetical protein ADK60_01675 [Streptomyces sp. XY431]|nr:hypothetical protein ADK60_01675 [Streptomyces sp. XY431]